MDEGVAERAQVFRDHSLYKTNAHYRAAQLAGRRAAMIGGAAVVLTALVGTSIFASINERPTTFVTIVAGVLVLLAAGLTALQTLFGARLADDAKAHRKAAASYASILRDVQLFQLEYRDSTDMPSELEALRGLADRLGQAEEDTLPVPDRLYDRAKRQRAGSGRRLVRTRRAPGTSPSP